MKQKQKQYVLIKKTFYLVSQLLLAPAVHILYFYCTQVTQAQCKTITTFICFDYINGL